MTRLGWFPGTSALWSLTLDMVLGMHEDDYEVLSFSAEWSAVFHPDFWNPFVVAYYHRVGGLSIEWSWLCQQVLEDFGNLEEKNYVSYVSDKGVLFGFLSLVS